ncbi:glycosyltransferase family 2 protein [Sphingobacterium bambusae]|uniref:Glycosyltransferase family 2 protein n=1 Tax=Sphingobacterium bambusae TaxID=662858 RepID=A0ABW6BHP1_9SPHI|nr:glycosyltransferase family 2 protein [Sphingobacterium bambusae]WPL47459.1 glycosyltransferase family 2 protein [Sphingobacterium bambusae]
MKRGFSVLMPTYNQATFIRRAILSLQKQTYTNWELIIINDGSTDDTLFFISDLLDDNKIRYINNEVNMGLGYALNKGLEAARYDYIAYLPSDDFYYENHLKTLMERFTAYAEAILIYSGFRYFINDTMVNIPNTESMGLKEDQPLQLVQTAHKKTVDRWLERDEWVTDSMFDMYWSKLINKGSFVPTKTISCFWTDHPHQRHKIIGERFGGGLNQYRSFYQIKTPVKMKTSKYKFIDEEKLYRNFRAHRSNGSPNSLKILIVGELAYNSERIYALEQEGHKLYGLWSKPELTFNTVGPLPFGNVTDLPHEDYEKSIIEIQPDIIYGLLNFVAVPLAYEVRKKFPDIPFVWHFKESPSVCLRKGTWDKLIYLFAYADGKIYLNQETQDWIETFIPKAGLSLLLDGDIPKGDFFEKKTSKKLSASDGHIHTLVTGRMVGITPEDMRVLAAHDIHLHLYTENYHNSREGLNSAMKSVAPDHFHTHPHVNLHNWTEEFSKYDAGWLHSIESKNNGNIFDVSWDDLNIPARTSTYAAAGLPLILKDNSEHIVAIQSKIDELGYGVLFNKIEDLIVQLKDEKFMSKLTKNAKKASVLFTFDHYAPRLTSFFHSVIKYKLDERSNY